MPGSEHKSKNRTPGDPITVSLDRSHFYRVLLLLRRNDVSVPDDVRQRIQNLPLGAYLYSEGKVYSSDQVQWKITDDVTSPHTKWLLQYFKV